MSNQCSVVQFSSVLFMLLCSAKALYQQQLIKCSAFQHSRYRILSYLNRHHFILNEFNYLINDLNHNFLFNFLKDVKLLQLYILYLNTIFSFNLQNPSINIFQILVYSMYLGTIDFFYFFVFIHISDNIRFNLLN